MNRQTLLIGFIFAIMLLTVSACGGTKLLDIEKTSNALNLSETQHNVVRSKVQQIEEIVEDYELEKETLAAGFAERRNQMRRGGDFGGRGSGGGVAVFRIRRRRSINSTQLSKNRLAP